MAFDPLRPHGLAWAGIAHLLAQQPRLRARLATHAGRIVRLRVGPFVQSDAVITADGSVEPVRGASPDATLTVRPSVGAAFDALQRGRPGLTPHLDVDGDLLVAAAMAEVLRDLRWDYEHDLSRVVGDIPAHRIGQGLRAVATETGRLHRAALDVIGRRLGHPSAGLGVSEAEARRHAVELRQLAARIGALEQRTGLAAGPLVRSPADRD